MAEIKRTARLDIREAAPTDAESTTPVRARIATGFESNLRIRLTPGAQVEHAPPRRCEPRNQGGPTNDLLWPADLMTKLREHDGDVVKWLAADQSRGKQFLADPVKALAAAGVDLSRAEQKAIARGGHHVRQGTVAPPGTVLKSIDVATFADGRIGKIQPGAKPKDHLDNGDDFGCGKGI